MSVGSGWNDFDPTWFAAWTALVIGISNLGLTWWLARRRTREDQVDEQRRLDEEEFNDEVATALKVVLGKLALLQLQVDEAARLIDPNERKERIREIGRAEWAVISSELDKYIERIGRWDPNGVETLTERYLEAEGALGDAQYVLGSDIAPRVKPVEDAAQRVRHTFDRLDQVCRDRIHTVRSRIRSGHLRRPASA